MAKNIIAIDPGSSHSGVTRFADGQIVGAAVLGNLFIIPMILWLSRTGDEMIVVIEDVRAYSLRLSQQLVDTCKIIGEWEWRLQQAGIERKLVARHLVKKWIYETYKAEIMPRIEKRIRDANMRNKDGKDRKASWVYVDDRIIITAMKRLWNIATPKPGKKSPYNLSSHSWQSLAAGSFFLNVLHTTSGNSDSTPG